MQNNVIAFSERATSMRKARAVQQLDQRAKELKYKQSATGKQVLYDDNLSDADLIALIKSQDKTVDTFYSILKFWKRHSRKQEKQLASATKKIARLEKQLAKFVQRNGKSSTV